MTWKTWGKLFVVAAMLGGCGSGSPPPAGLPQGSWIQPGATNGDLLYVSNFYGGDVTVYSYPAGKLVGTLTGFSDAAGECSDSAGNVFVTDYANADIIEFAHGGTTPIATLDEAGLRPLGCSVDPTTGNLAVSNLDTNGFLHGDLSIFPHASGTPQLYFNPNFFYYYFCSYDDDGNVYVSGSGPVSVYEPQVAVLAAGGRKLKSVKFKEGLPDARGIAWDGSYLAIGQESTTGSQIAQYQISGTTAKLVGTTVLEGAKTVNEFWIDGGGRNKRATLIAPNFVVHDVGYYHYPAGGNPFKTIRHGLDYSYGATVSRAR